jgi:hypothetical protein
MQEECEIVMLLICYHFDPLSIIRSINVRTVCEQRSTCYDAVLVLCDAVIVLCGAV